MECIHGFEHHTWCSICKPKKTGKKRKKATDKKARIKKSLIPSVKKKIKVCSLCQKYLREKGANGKCIFCAQKIGYKVCNICTKMFIPKPPSVKNCGCKLKKGKLKRGGGSVWIVASAGLPSLGRKR